MKIGAMLRYSFSLIGETFSFLLYFILSFLFMLPDVGLLPETYNPNGRGMVGSPGDVSENPVT